jgi:hypothetical protein
MHSLLTVSTTFNQLPLQSTVYDGRYSAVVGRVDIIDMEVDDGCGEHIDAMLSREQLSDSVGLSKPQACYIA